MLSQDPAQTTVHQSDQGIGPIILGVSWTLTTLCILVLIPRFYIRKKITGSLSSDDWIMLMSVVFQVAYQAFLTLLCHYGLGKIAEDLTLIEFTMIQKWTWISAPFAYAASILARVSITIFLVHIFGTKSWFKWFLIGFTSLLALNGALVTIISLVQVRPLEGLWDPSIPAVRWNPRIEHYSAFLLIVLLAASDLTFVFFPVAIIWKLNMRTRRKVSLMLLMAASFVTFAAALTKVVINAINLVAPLETRSTLDIRLSAGLVNLLSSIEQSLVIIIGCLPILRSVTKLGFPGMGEIGASFNNLISRVKGTGSNRWNFSDKCESTVSQELRLRPKLWAVEEGHVPHSSTVMAYKVESNPNLEDAGHIWRTDDFTLACNNQGTPATRA